MINPTTLLHSLPSGLRIPLVEAYREIAKNYAEHRWEPSELNGGKLCEIAYSIVDGATSGTFPNAPHKPARLVDACRAIELRQANPTLVGDRSLRILIPRLLPYLYEIRNNRGVGHIGGEVSPNLIDATAVFSCASWIMAEFVRIFHGVPLTEAQSAVELLVERKLALVWEIEGNKRVLDSKLSRADQMLVLLYSSNSWVAEADMRKWVEYANGTQFRKCVILPLHKERLVEYDAPKQRLQITPLGAKDVEDRILAIRL